MAKAEAVAQAATPDKDAAEESLNVALGISFYPRGGSAYAVRNTALELVRAGVETTIVTGSYEAPDIQSAAAFYSKTGARIGSLDFTAGLNSSDPRKTTEAVQYSMENKVAADVYIFSVDDGKDDDGNDTEHLEESSYERSVAHWMKAFEDAGIAEAQIIHLNHVSPMNEAVLRLQAAGKLNPNVHFVGSFHGTEFLALKNYRDQCEKTGKHDPLADRWVERFQRWAEMYERVIVVSERELDRAKMYFPGVPEDRYEIITHGVDADDFHYIERSPEEQLKLWRRFLVEEPLGWKPGEAPGSIKYTEEQIQSLASADPERRPLITAGRFTEAKDQETLLAAYKELVDKEPNTPPLVIVGGKPGEWEGRHPYEIAKALGLQDGKNVFFVGWHEQKDLSILFTLASVFVLASPQETLGLVIIEGMACGVPAVITNGGGQAEVVLDGVEGLHVPPKDKHALALAMGRLLTEPGLRARMSEAGMKGVAERYSWKAQILKLIGVYRELVG